ncbi:hypothetical protein EW093_11260 [Thiospirochaeta perfilievii]|uniref:CARDB domain-containing protein n=1 Tax=Thiospirochaeta perfilievii TaxID=252967 RepID=A0A5C1QF96_9SPIO|nr:hypothetical protein [Thiospirochaeta perfilievii]QEN05266.1 hypothetical protein EW093_11260 [Thiospirochaeta perfilievii]
MKKIFLALFIISVMSCNNIEDWYPTGDVGIESYRVYLNKDTEKKECLLNYKISNTGNVDISTTTFSLTIKTDKGSYATSEILEVTIQSGKSIINNKTIIFIEDTEFIENQDNIIINSIFLINRI